MKAVLEIEEIRRTINQWRSDGAKIALVPTMGALHSGHLELVKAANDHADKVIVSIYVNPTQFGPGEDFEKYPRTFKEDLEALRPLNVDAVFAPSNAEMYPTGFETFVDNPKAAKDLCGKFRPGHFKGVCTVVTKLFRVVQPNLAVFGKKDYQQLKVIEALTRDLHLDVEILSVDTIRAEDGVAISSRNRFLSEEQRSLATLIPMGLNACFDQYESGVRDPKGIVKAFMDTVHEFENLQIEYVEVRRASNLAEFDQMIDDHPVVLVAARIGEIRLIDNLELS